MAEHIVAVFETEAAAAAAEQSLLSIGIPSSVIRRYARNAAIPEEEVAPGGYTSTHTSGGGFWAWLFGEDSTSETSRSAYTHDLYDRRVAAGNVVLGVLVDDDAKLHQVASVLEAHQPVDIGEGWEGIGDTDSNPGVTSVTGASTPAPSGRVGATKVPPASAST